MSTVNIERWIDLDSADFKRTEKPTFIRKVLNIGIEEGIITVDKAGYMWKGSTPVHTELDGELVGLRYAAKAVN